MHPPLDDVRRIALLRANALGDFIFLLPALEALRHAYPRARVTLLAKEWHARFLCGRPSGIDEVVEIPSLHGLGGDGLPEDAPGHVEAFCARMRAQRFDVAFQMQGGGRNSNALVNRLGARTTVGARTPDAEPLDRWIAYQPLQNERLRLLEIAGLAGAPPCGLDPPIALVARDLRELRRAWRPHGAALVVLQPGANDPRRRWPPERFAAVGDALAARGAQIAINGTARERETTAAVVRAMRSPALDLSGALSISGLAALLSRARLLVSNDTGPLHLAHAVGIPSVGIYWCMNLIASAPLAWEGRRHAVACSVCCPVCGEVNLDRRCAHDASFVAEVPVDEVLRLALELFDPAVAPAHRAAAVRGGAPRRPRSPRDREPRDAARHRGAPSATDRSR
jgi:ADP-heptose:LPS heptosyltransferase